MDKYELSATVAKRIKLNGLKGFQAYQDVKAMLGDMKLTLSEYQDGCKCAANILKI